jgi:LPS-assembly protein
VRFTASQGYQLSGGRRDLLVMVDYGRPFTDSQLMLELFPWADWRIFTDTRISPYNGDVTNSLFGFEGGNSKGSRVSVNYYHAKDEVEYISGTISYAEFKPYTVTATGRYSFDRPGFLETLYSLEYKGQCWGVIFSYQDRPDDTLYSFKVNLSGLGMFELL